MDFPSTTVMHALIWELSIFALLLIVWPEPWLYICYGILNVGLTVKHEWQSRRENHNARS